MKIDLKNNTVKVRYPFDETWLNFELRVDKRIYQYTFDHYSVAISFREGKIRILISIPFKPEYNDGKYIASFDLNSDRINMVIVSKTGIIKDVKNKHFHYITSHGFPANKAKNIRLQALAKLLDYAKHHNCGTVLFEKLKMKNKNKTKSKKGNRKITKFSIRQFLDYGINMALRRGFRVYLVNPSGTTKEAKKVHRQLGLDIHTTSAYILALKFLKYRYPRK